MSADNWGGWIRTTDLPINSRDCPEQTPLGHNHLANGTQGAEQHRTASDNDLSATLPTDPPTAAEGGPAALRALAERWTDPDVRVRDLVDAMLGAASEWARAERERDKAVEARDNLREVCRLMQETLEMREQAARRRDAFAHITGPIARAGDDAARMDPAKVAQLRALADVAVVRHGREPEPQRTAALRAFIREACDRLATPAPEGE
jgi:hypothetical protein